MRTLTPALACNRRDVRGAAALLSLLLLLTGCAGREREEQATASDQPRIALLLPESKTARYESHDRPLFERKVDELCPACNVLYFNANQDVSLQQNQAEAAMTSGATVLVLDPVDFKSATSVVREAKSKGIRVISYDRMIPNAPIDHYISFDNERTGRLMANSLVNILKRRGKHQPRVVMINGSPTDSTGNLVKKGAHSVFAAQGVKIAKEYDTPDWSPDKAQSEMDQAITALGHDGFEGVYAANDGVASGVIAAMNGAGIDPSERPVTGQDAELAAIQRILRGDQHMTVYKAIKPQAEVAAQLAVGLATEREPDNDALIRQAGHTPLQIDNGFEPVDSVILTPVSVTRENIKQTVVADGFWRADQICTTSLKQVCQRLRLI
jgi:D-xylose transport system substrate-binding protein